MTSPQLLARLSFKITYSVDTVILVKVKEPNLRIIFRSTNPEAFLEEADLASKVQKMAHIWEMALKQKITRTYNSVAIPRRFKEGDLVLR